MDTRVPSPDQQAVLESSARVRVVRAAPGSGKTWLVAEIIRREVDGWSSSTSGIAALSFTRVGGDEIRNAVGRDLNHPHFVGTLDSFLFRYVVRPFLRQCCKSCAVPRLLPSELGAQHWEHWGRGQKVKIGKGINVLECVFIDEEQNKPVIAYKPHPAQPLTPLVGDNLKKVKDAKIELWTRSGMLTHSDAAWWASQIIGNQKFGAVIRNEIIRRFPLIIVDELQDTGYFLGKSILQLLEDSRSRAVLVGDPDQAIYEFNGARPELFGKFESIEGATTLLLSTSKRCPPAAAGAASHLKATAGVIHPATNKRGHAYLLYYTSMIADVRRLANSLNDRGVVKLVTRKTATVDQIFGKMEDQPSLGCIPLNHMLRAVVSFRQGRRVRSAASAEAAVALAVFGHEDVEESELKEAEIDPMRWKQFVIDCLLTANGEPLTGSIYDWECTVGRLVADKLTLLNLPAERQNEVLPLKPRKIRNSQNPCTQYIPQKESGAISNTGVLYNTVHGVKGETHDVTIFVCPHVNSPRYCPSVIWWSGEEKHQEEKRIAYVAMTRTQGDLLVCVPHDVYQRLSRDHTQFVGCFECMSVDDYIAGLANTA